MRLTTIGVVVVALLAGVRDVRADASTPAAPSGRSAATARWLTGRDGLPAFSVADRAILSPRTGADCRWVTVGSRWRLVDRVGVSVGEARVTKLERDELWPCKMATFRGPTQRGRLMVERAAGEPRPTALWTPTDADRLALQSITGARGDALYFATTAGRFAAVVSTDGTHALIARWVAGATWAIEWQDRRPATPEALHYRDPAVVDLDGDGAPEVILGWWQDTDYGDYILGRAAPGTWRQLAESFPGNTI